MPACSMDGVFYNKPYICTMEVATHITWNIENVAFVVVLNRHLATLFNGALKP